MIISGFSAYKNYVYNLLQLHFSGILLQIINKIPENSKVFSKTCRNTEHKLRLNERTATELWEWLLHKQDFLALLQD